MATKRIPRPRDPLALAKLIGDIATGQVVDAVDETRRGRAGGLKGGVARRDRLSATEREEIAKRAAMVRWGKPNG
jgi:hypothetical protein